MTSVRPSADGGFFDVPRIGVCEPRPNPSSAGVPLGRARSFGSKSAVADFFSVSEASHFMRASGLTVDGIGQPLRERHWPLPSEAKGGAEFSLRAGLGCAGEGTAKGGQARPLAKLKS